MANIVTIESTQSHVTIMRRLLRQVDKGGTHRFYSSTGEFIADYMALAKKVATATPEDSHEIFQDDQQAMDRIEGVDGENIPESMSLKVHLILVAFESIDNDLYAWLTQIKNSFKGKLPKIIALKYEDDGIHKSKVISPCVNDLIFYPIDETIFLQKVEILLGLPERVPPQYLYVQQTEMPLDLSLKSNIYHLSDVGVGVEFSRPFRVGLTARLHFKLPGREIRIETLGKVIRNVPHPDSPKLTVVYFCFFATEPSVANELYKYFSSIGGYKSLKVSNFGKLRFDPEPDPDSEDSFTVEQRRLKTVVIIDPNKDVRRSLTEKINSNMDQVKIVADSSFFMFCQDYLTPKSDKGTVPAEPGDFFSKKASWTVTYSSKQLVELHTPYDEPEDDGPEVLLFRHPVDDLFGTPDGWLQLFGRKGRAFLEEVWVQIKMTKFFEAEFVIKPKSGKLKTALLSFTLVNKGENVQLELSVPDTDSLLEKEPLDSLDMILINQSIVMDDLYKWIEDFHQMVFNMGLEREKPPKLVLLCEKNAMKPDEARDLPVDGFLYLSPSDRNLMFLVSNLLDNPFTLYHFDNIGWRMGPLDAYMSKQIKTTELSEFGVTILSKTPIKVGSVLYLHGGLFENASDKLLCVRCYYCEKKEKEEVYLCYFIYFGITETFLTHMRAMFKETFISSKKQQEDSP